MIPQRFILPVVLAAAIHAALLAIVPSPEPVEFEPVEKRVVIPFPAVNFYEPPPPAAADQERGGGSGEPVATLSEPPVLPRPGVFVVDVPTPSAAWDDLKSDRVPINPGPLGPGELNLAGPGSGPVGKDFLDHEPRARARIAPDYPYDAKSRGLKGTVEVAFVVGTGGSVQNAHVVRSDHRELESAAVRAVMRWKFEPGKYQGRPVSFRMAVPIVFRLDAE